MKNVFSTYKESRNANIIAEGESFMETDVICPYCGNEADDYHDMLSDRACDESEITCYKCDKEFIVTWEAVYSTRVKRE